MFLGEYTHKLDSKNRLMIPSDFREGLAGDIYLTKGPENSLILYNEEEFKKKSKSLDEMAFDNKKNRAIKRLFFSSTNKLSLDKQGRILISKSLRDYAKIEGELMVIGNNTSVEIWAKKVWQDYISEVEVNLSDLMDD